VVISFYLPAFPVILVNDVYFAKPSTGADKILQQSYPAQLDTSKLLLFRYYPIATFCRGNIKWKAVN
jgi:hypothetical protein